MESVDWDGNSVDEEISLLNESDSSNLDKKSGSTTTGFDESDDTRSELKFDEGKVCYECNFGRYKLLF